MISFANQTAREVDILCVQRGDNLCQGQLTGHQPVFSELYSDLALQAASDPHGGDAVHGLDFAL